MYTHLSRTPKPKTGRTTPTPSTDMAPGKTRSKSVDDRVPLFLQSRLQALTRDDTYSATLPNQLRSQFETSLGTGLPDVRLHTNSTATEAADHLGARAFNTGHDIYFAAGEYAPDSESGRYLLAHEVAHVAQRLGQPQSGNDNLSESRGPDRIGVGALDDPAERDAETVASALVTELPIRVTPALTPIGLIRRHPRIDSMRRGQSVIYRLRPGSWRVHWADIHSRVAAIADLQRFAQVFSVNDLSRGSVVSRAIVLPDGSPARVDIASRRAAGREGVTRLVGPAHVHVVFNRGAELEVALGLSAFDPIPATAVADANRDPDRLQQALDDQVFEVLVHELSHALIILEGHLPSSAAHSATFNEFSELLEASRRASAAVAAAQVDIELRLLIRALVDANVPAPRNDQVMAAVSADPDLAADNVRRWFLSERTARTDSDRAAGTATDNATLAGSYVESLRRTIRAKISRVANLRSTRSGGGEGLSTRVRIWLDGAVANVQTQRVTPMPPTSRLTPSNGQQGDAGAEGAAGSEVGYEEGVAPRATPDTVLNNPQIRVAATADRM